MTRTKSRPPSRPARALGLRRLESAFHARREGRAKHIVGTASLLVAALAVTLLTFVSTTGLSAESLRVGAIGCSNTVRILDETPTLEVEDLFWPGRTGAQKDHPYGGGVLDKWADTSSEEWGAFIEYMELYPDTTQVVWQLCNYYRMDREPNDEDVALTQTIADNVAAAYPQVMLYAVGVHTPSECRRIG